MKNSVRIKRPSLLPVAVAVGVVAAIGYGGWAYYSIGQDIQPQTRVLGAPSLVPSVMSAYSHAPAEEAATVKADTKAMQAVTFGPPKSTVLAALIKSGTPEALYQAYEMTYECMEARKLVPDKPAYIDKRCGDIQQGQLAGRIDYLKAGALAGYPRAWFALYLEQGGYFSEGSFPDTPENKAFMQAAYKVAVDKADPNVLLLEVKQLSKSASTEDRAKAVMYQTAFLVNSKVGLDHPASVPSLEPSVQRLAAGLPPALVTKAISDGIVYANRRMN